MLLKPYFYPPMQPSFGKLQRLWKYDIDKQIAYFDSLSQELREQLHTVMFALPEFTGKETEVNSKRVTTIPYSVHRKLQKA